MSNQELCPGKGCQDQGCPAHYADDYEAVFGDHNLVPSLQTEVEQLKTKLDYALKMLENSVGIMQYGDFSTGYCCCGDSMSHPGIGYGHSPVDQGDYAAVCLIREIEEFLEKQLTPTINPV
jgi:hypothetical protein